MWLQKTIQGPKSVKWQQFCCMNMEKNLEIVIELFKYIPYFLIIQMLQLEQIVRENFLREHENEESCNNLCIKIHKNNFRRERLQPKSRLLSAISVTVLNDDKFSML